MTVNLTAPDIRELKPRITVFGVGGAGGNAVNNMIAAGLQGVEFVVANTDAQALSSSRAPRKIQMGVQVTEGLGAGSQPEVGKAAAEEVIDEIRDHLNGAHMVFVTAGMGGGTGTGAAPVVAKVARDMGILTVGVVTKPFQFEGDRRMRYAEGGIAELQKNVDTLLIIPNQNLFRVANEKTTFADAFAMADRVLYSGVACVTDLMVKEGLINLDFADVRAVMREMGKAMMGTGEASGEKRAITAAEAAIANPLIDDNTMKGAKGLLISITGGKDLTLYEVDEAATRIREEVDKDANIIVGATFDDSLEGIIRVAVVATGVDRPAAAAKPPVEAAKRSSYEIPRPLERQKPAAAATPVHAPQPAPAQAPAHVASIDAAATAAVAAALEQEMGHDMDYHPAEGTAIDDVTIRPTPPKPSLFVEPAAPAPAPQPETFGNFIPPHPERVPQRPRMPRIDELPPQAQREIQAHRGELVAPEPEKQRMSLLKRLASAGLGLKTEQDEPPAQQDPRMMAPPVPPRMPQRPAPRPAEGRDPVSDYARRPPHAPQGLDMHGRTAPVNNPPEDDQLEIPAFLRRQAN
ncbi:cell division protein FtsZ [Pseudorhodoplanes sp.]|uniref:cell division protein FtsZ n=1 Tax=Pseudorhodoplanes sp. TaxID=1934341 RepID=UPI002B5C116C|nr:cell division protein FtsZ [Pseudorhodoplanes sp.]HWV40389.1 cell division protein FtsZ [Pseudorhodoplanes sp.]